MGGLFDSLTPDPVIRPAQPGDLPALSALLGREYYIHRHLDWHPPLEWLGHKPFWLAEQHGTALAALALPPDPPEIAWIRLFAASGRMMPSAAWHALFGPALAELAPTSSTLIAAVGLNRWFNDLLLNNKFEHYQDIVVLSWDTELPNPRSLPANLSVRPMRPEDLPAVAEVDNLAFEPLWRNSLVDIEQAYRLAGYSSVVEQDGRILGFQISTSTPMVTHLARLAVRPDAQRQNIGYVLVYNLFSWFKRHGAWQLTVNTEHTNHASLALYASMGFERTGDSFPVFLYHG